MRLFHWGKCPHIHPSACVPPTAVICGDAANGENSRMLFGAAITAEGGPVKFGGDPVIITLL